MAAPLPACWDPGVDCQWDDAAGCCPCRPAEPPAERDTETVTVTGEVL